MMNTVQLIQLAKSGDMHASEELCKKYTPKALEIARYRMGKKIRQKTESMDIVQEALMSAWLSLKDFTYKNDGDFINWLAKIIENRIRDNYENISAKKRDINREVPLDKYGNSNQWYGCVSKFIQTTTPSEIVSKREMNEKLNNAIDKLKDDYKEVIFMMKSNLSIQEMAEALDKTPGSIKMLLARAKMKLAEYIGEEK